MKFSKAMAFLLCCTSSVATYANEKSEGFEEMGQLALKHFLCMNLVSIVHIDSEDERLLVDSRAHWREAVRLYREQFPLMLEAKSPDGISVSSMLQPATELDLGADYFAGLAHAGQDARVDRLISFKCIENDMSCTSFANRQMFASRIYRDENCHSLIKNKDASANYEAGLAAIEVGDYSTAFDQFKALAEQGDMDSQYNVAGMYYRGDGVAQDYKAAMNWYAKAATQGNAFAQTNLALMYREGRGVEQDYKESVAWYTKAAEQGHAEAQSNLGVMYNNGLGITQDYREAIKWHTKAANQGHANAQYNLALMYYHGEGTPKNDKEAVNWYAKAAEQGLTAAQLNLGVMYYNGEGVEHNKTTALMWINLASYNGDELATKPQSTVAKQMTPDQIAEAQRLALGCVKKHYKDC